jgi:hypothetical protein
MTIIKEKRIRKDGRISRQRLPLPASQALFYGKPTPFHRFKITFRRYQQLEKLGLEHSKKHPLFYASREELETLMKETREVILFVSLNDNEELKRKLNNFHHFLWGKLIRRKYFK